MRCLWLENKSLRLREMPLVRPKPHQALVRVRLAGICATDLELTRGYLPFAGILGHEFVGEVVEAPHAPNWIGKRVVSEINVACLSCSTCLAGHKSHCPHRSVLGIANQDGVFAEYVCIDLPNLHAVPDEVSDEAAVFTEPLAAACRIGEQICFRKDQRVLLIGAGRLGLLVAQVVANEPGVLRVMAKYPVQKKILSDMGIQNFDPDKDKAAFFDVVIEATGSEAGFAEALTRLRPMGTLVLKSTYAKSPKVDLSRLVVNEIQVIGSRCGPFPKAISMLERKQVDPLPLIQHRYSLEQGLTAMEKASQAGVLKVLLDPAL